MKSPLQKINSLSFKLNIAIKRGDQIRNPLCYKALLIRSQVKQGRNKNENKKPHARQGAAVALRTLIFSALAIAVTAQGL